jgi:hypothetical protein
MHHYPLLSTILREREREFIRGVHTSG